MGQKNDNRKARGIRGKKFGTLFGVTLGVNPNELQPHDASTAYETQKGQRPLNKWTKIETVFSKGFNDGGHNETHRAQPYWGNANSAPIKRTARPGSNW